MCKYIINRFGIATNSAILNLKNSDSFNPIYENVLKNYKKLVHIDYDKPKSLIEITVETMSATTSADIVKAYIEKLEDFSVSPQKARLKFIETDTKNC